MHRQLNRPFLRWIALLALLTSVLSGCTGSSSGNDSSTSRANAGRTPSSDKLAYVALGDSFTSAPLVPVTDVANGCFRSSANYPALVARTLSAHLDDRSCGGAQVVHLATSQYPEVKAQLDAVRAETDVVTLGIGGNDQGLFAQLTGKCPQLRASDPTGAPCRDEMHAGGRDLLRAGIAKTGSAVTDALREIHERAPQAQVLVIGYPQIVSPGNACSKLPLARGDYAYVAGINVALNTMLEKAASATRSTYVDVAKASRGHDLCADDPWVNGSVTDQKRAAAYHPFAEEQVAVADLVVAGIRR